jgi:hypothetical protein
LFRDWSRGDFDEVIRLMRMLADGMRDAPAPIA